MKCTNIFTCRQCSRLQCGYNSIANFSMKDSCVHIKKSFKRWDTKGKSTFTFWIQLKSRDVIFVKE